MLEGLTAGSVCWYGVTRSTAGVTLAEYDLLCLDGRGRVGAMEVVEASEELAEWIREGRSEESVVVDERSCLESGCEDVVLFRPSHLY